MAKTRRFLRVCVLGLPALDGALGVQEKGSSWLLTMNVQSDGSE